jgi:hypothetical protein
VLPDLGAAGLPAAARARCGRPAEVDSLIADCKSGVSGAGRKAEVHTLLAEASDNFKAYGVAGHRHWPEIRQGLTAIAQRPVNLVFTPHLVPDDPRDPLHALRPAQALARRRWIFRRCMSGDSPTSPSST